MKRIVRLVFGTLLGRVVYVAIVIIIAIISMAVVKRQWLEAIKHSLEK